MKVRDFIRVGVRGRHPKSLRALMDPLVDAVCCAAKWLKSSLEVMSVYLVKDQIYLRHDHFPQFARIRLFSDRRGEHRQALIIVLAPV